nr:hypothetical protein [Lentilactobacillus sp. Marseille-Q4993]
MMNQFNVPIMIAISRKSFSSRLFDLDKADDRLIPTLLFETLMTVFGGSLIRTHDVKETKMLIDAYEEIKSEL